MPLDFTVIVTVRQRFGDSDQDDFGQETEAPFVGQQRIFLLAVRTSTAVNKQFCCFKLRARTCRKAWKSTAKSSLAGFQVP